MYIIRKFKVLLASRGLFSNWFFAGIKYYLAKNGLFHTYGVEIVCNDNSKSLIPWKAYGNLVNEYYDGYLSGYDCDEDLAIYSKIYVPVKEIEISTNVGLATKDGWIYDLVNRYWLRNDVKFRHMRWPILEVFDFGSFEGIDVNNRVVVDVGAYVGDSAVYFVLKGARKVIAIEPHPGAFAEMLDNIKLNNLENVIIPINAGLASKPGKICIENVDASNTFAIYHRPGDCPNTVPAVTLGELISRFGIDPNDAVLKMDCEGCEFDVILNDYGSVRLFSEVVFEYHSYATNRSVIELINTMGKDFNCQLMNEKFYKKYFGSYSRDQLGLIRCVRRR